MKALRVSLLLALFVYGSAKLWAGSEPTPVAALEQALLRLDAAAVDAQLERMRADALTVAFYRSHARFVAALATQDPARVSAYFTGSDDLLERLDTDDYTQALYAAETYLERAILKGLEQRNWAAYFDARRCFSLARELERRQPGRIDHQKLLGTFESVAGAVPESYQWLARLLGFGGDLKRGLARLERAAGQSPLLRMEARVATVLALKQLAGQPARAQARLDSLLAECPGAPVLSFLAASQALDAKQLERARALLGSPALAGAVAMPFLDFLRGRLALYDGDWVGAEGHFGRFLAAPNPKLLRRAAQARIGLIHALKREPEAAGRALEAVTRLPASLADEDAYALRLAKEYLAQPYGPVELALLRARFEFDAGKLAQSLATLQALANQKLTPVQQIERDYRVGRALHELGRGAEAEQHYRATQAPEVPTRLWMKVYSLFYLGTLAEQRGERASARWCYEQVLSYRGYDYRAGLESKAKAALSRVR